MAVALERLVESAGVDAVQACQIGIQDHPMPANPEDQRLKPLGVNGFSHVTPCPGSTI
jgi:hypothetical protein